jgi:hypothetical protein
MADTIAAPTNKAVLFRGRPKNEHVPVAKIPKKRAARKAVRTLKARGMISEKQGKRHLDDFD